MVAQTMVRQLVSKVQHIDLIGALAHIAEETFNGIGGLNVAVHRLRKGVKCEEVLFILRQASHCFRIAHSILGECSRPIGSTPPAWWLAPRCPPVRLAHRRALVWGWRQAHCVWITDFMTRWSMPHRGKASKRCL